MIEIPSIPAAMIHEVLGGIIPSSPSTLVYKVTVVQGKITIEIVPDAPI